MRKKVPALLALLGLGLLCFAQTTDPAYPYASANPMPSPTIFGEGVISTGDYEMHPAFTPDGRTLYFVKSTPVFSFWTIVVSQFVDGQWTTPEMAPFSGQCSDADPFVTADGKQLYFISRRPATGKTTPDLDIWVMDKTPDGWSEPRNMGGPVNSPADESYPTLAADGTLYFGSGRPGGKGGTDLYRARFANGRCEQPENLGEAVNTEFDEYEPYIATDQSYLFFMASGRRDNHSGSADLYISLQKDGVWTEARNLGDEINSHREEYSPKVSPDGKYFFFSSTRGRRPSGKRMNYAELLAWLRSPRNGLGDIYQVDLRSVVPIDSGSPIHERRPAGPGLESVSVADRFENAIRTKEPRFALVSKHMSNKQEAKYVLQGWRSNGDIVSATTYELASREEAAEELRKSLQAPMSVPVQTITLTQLGDEAYMRPHIYAREGQTTLFFRKGKYMIVLSASTPDLAKRSAKHMANEID